MTDRTEKIGRTLIHHGRDNNRAYLMSLNGEDPSEALAGLEKLADNQGYTKIIVKVPASCRSDLAARDYRIEAEVPKFYHGDETGLFAAKYLDSDRKIDLHISTWTEILRKATAESETGRPGDLPPGFAIREAGEADAPEMAALYDRVFASYPSPIHDEAYIIQTMRENLRYFGVWHNNRLAGLSSIEWAAQYANAEMTDFAVDKTYRGQGLAWHLLDSMENTSREMGIRTVYSIARAKSPGMNMTFARQGYAFGGTLINNTNIAGQIESMNVWYKSLQ